MTNAANLSFQLYSARAEPSLDAKLKVLADVGYGQAEPYRGLYEDVDGLRQGLKRYGLRAATGHFGFGEIRDDPARTIDIAKVLGMDVAVVSALPVPEREKDLAGWRATARELKGYAEMFEGAGLRLAWHNHAFEFARLEDGSMPLDHLLGGAPSVLWQVDIGWLYRAKQDPVVWFSKFGDRVFSIHLKDIAPAGACLDEDGWADLGHGVIDWQALWPAIERLHPAVFTVEHDKPSDYRRFARRSAEAFLRMTGGH